MQPDQNTPAPNPTPTPEPAPMPTPSPESMPTPTPTQVPQPTQPAQPIQPSQPIQNTDSFKADLPPIAGDSAASNIGRKILRVIITLFIIGVIGVAGFFIYSYVTGVKTPVSDIISSVTPSAPLTSSTRLHTTFEYPEGWVPQQNFPGAAFQSSEVDDTGYPLATVIVAESALDATLVNASAETYTSLRESYFKTGLEKPFEVVSGSSEIVCRGQSKEVVKDTEQTETIIGLTIVTTTKPCESGERISKKRTVVGTDGYMRYIDIDATPQEWTKSQSTFEKMFSSLTVAK